MDWQQTDKRHEPPTAAACCDCLYKPRHPPLLGDSRNLSFTRTIVIRPALCSSQKMSKRMATASIDLTIAIARTMSFTCATESRPLRRVFSMIRVIRFSFGAMLISSSSCGITCDVMLMLWRCHTSLCCTSRQCTATNVLHARQYKRNKYEPCFLSAAHKV